jgi:hypothetical protein
MKGTVEIRPTEDCLLLRVLYSQDKNIRDGACILGNPMVALLM